LDVSTPAAGVALHRPVAGKLFAGFPVLDVRAKTEYKRRLKELRQDLEEAERFNDPQRKTETQDEMQAIAAHLAYGVGLGDRDRKTSSNAERARSAITKCIKKAIQKIGDAIPSLGCHLATRIKTGYFCSYNPRPDRPAAWEVLPGSGFSRVAIDFARDKPIFFLDISDLIAMQEGRDVLAAAFSDSRSAAASCDIVES
jgi:hypothetical protein